MAAEAPAPAPTKPTAAATTPTPAPAPALVAPASSAVDDSYIIGPGDSIQVFVWRSPELTVTVPVRPDGKISTPLVEDLVAVGKSPSQLIQERVMLEAKKQLHLTHKSIKEVAAALHFSDEHYFSRFFKKQAGISPTVFREKVGISIVADLSMK